MLSLRRTDLWKVLPATFLLAVAGCSDDPQTGPGNTGSGATGGTAGGAGGTGATSGSTGSGGSAAGSSSTGGTSGSANSGGSGGTTGGAAGSGGSTGGTSGGSGGSGGGTPTDSGLPVPPGEGNVPKPSGAQGGLEVIDWAGFTGAISYTFDDTNSSQISNFTALMALGVRFTWYLQTNKTTEIASPVWKQAAEAGHELGNHTSNHANPAPADGSNLDAANTVIEAILPGLKVYTMAAPEGSTTYSAPAMSRFIINRGVSGQLISANETGNAYDLPCYFPTDGGNAQELAAGLAKGQMDGWVASARTNKKWATILVHGFTGGSDGAYKRFPLQEFLDHVTETKAAGDLWLDSVVNVGSYWLGQKAVSSVTPTTSGSDQTWTWTLPDHFPPGKYVRVTVTGGTLKQGGVELAWDPHGYYEVALDEGSMTLSP